MFVYSSYHLNISFPSSGSHFNKLERVLETPKNGFVSTVMLWITLNKTNPGKNITNNFTTQIFIPKKITESKISNPKKSFDHPSHLKSRVPPLGSAIRPRDQKKIDSLFGRESGHPWNRPLYFPNTGYLIIPREPFLSNFILFMCIHMHNIIMKRQRVTKAYKLLRGLLNEP